MEISAFSYFLNYPWLFAYVDFVGLYNGFCWSTMGSISGLSARFGIYEILTAFYKGMSQAIVSFVLGWSWSSLQSIVLNQYVSHYYMFDRYVHSPKFPLEQVAQLGYGLTWIWPTQPIHWLCSCTLWPRHQFYWYTMKLTLNIFQTLSDSFKLRTLRVRE